MYEHIYIHVFNPKLKKKIKLAFSLVCLLVKTVSKKYWLNTKKYDNKIHP